MIDVKKSDQKREEELHESRELSYYQDDDGMWIIKAKLPAEEGGLLVKVLQELGNNLQEKTSLKTGVEKDSEKNSAGTF